MNPATAPGLSETLATFAHRRRPSRRHAAAPRRRRRRSGEDASKDLEADRARRAPVHSLQADSRLTAARAIDLPHPQTPAGDSHFLSIGAVEPVERGCRLICLFAKSRGCDRQTVAFQADLYEILGDKMIVKLNTKIPVGNGVGTTDALLDAPQKTVLNATTWVMPSATEQDTRLTKILSEHVSAAFNQADQAMFTVQNELEK